jgi:hypothetical protein
MKKVLFAVFVLFCAAGVSLYAWEAEDLKTYPEGITPGTLIFNAGVGLGHFNFSDYLVLPLHVEGEVAVPLGSTLHLPFGFGGIISYSGDKGDYYDQYLGLQFRILYHFNWLIPKLDTYIAVDTGWVFHFTDGPDTTIGFLDIGLNMGGRYFFIPAFGVFGEVSLPMTSFFWPGALGHLGWIKAGITLKF